jgi:cell division protein FtsZ
MNSTPEPTVAPAPTRTPNLKAFGVGSAGLNVLEQLARQGIPPASLIAVHSDASALAACPAGEKVHLNNKTAPGLNSARPAENAPAPTPEDQMPRLKSLCSGADVVFVLAGLGGSLGTELGAVLAGVAREAASFVVVVGILPFDCEGSLRARVAHAALKRIQESADLVIGWPNQKTFGLLDQSTSLLDTFKGSNQLLSDCLRGAWRALSSETVIGLRFLELCGAIRQHSPECAFAIAEASGPNRATEALERVLAHPILQLPHALEESRAVAVSVLGGPSLGMGEVNRVMEQLHRCCDNAPVLMGASITPELGDSLVISLLLAPPDRDALADEQFPESQGRAENLGVHLLDPDVGIRPQSRFVPPAPTLPPEKMAQLLKQQSRGPGRRKTPSKLRQTQLPLEIVSKGRFDKSEPTIHKGEDLDVPTYIRRGVSLN